MEPDYIIWKITESEEELRAGLSHPELYADKVKNLKPGSRRMLEVLAVRRALKELFYGKEKEVLYTSDGAPYLEGGPHISISHTNGYAAVIASDKAVGIDIERLGTRVEKVVSHFLKPEELVILELQSQPDSQPSSVCTQLPVRNLTLGLHLAWSAKEAAYKVLGKDYYDLRQRTSVLHINWATNILLLSVDDKPQPLVVHFDVTPDYVLTIVL